MLICKNGLLTIDIIVIPGDDLVVKITNQRVFGNLLNFFQMAVAEMFEVDGQEANLAFDQPLDEPRNVPCETEQIVPDRLKASYRDVFHSFVYFRDYFRADKRTVFCILCSKHDESQQVFKAHNDR